MRNMKRVYTLLFLFTLMLSASTILRSEERYLPVKGNFPTRFLIVVDSKSYADAQNELNLYKSQLESENLGVELLIGNWSSPEELKSSIIKIYNKKPVMEGAIFIGNIPVVRVQNFQHATTAFKMDEEKFPIEDASVTSDRYYDDLDLKFEFISKDKSKSNIFYYKLSETSPQKVASEFYSARVLPPSDYGEESGELIKRFLIKAVNAHRNFSELDMLKVFNGHGYNSDCLTVWQEQQFEMKEDFPVAFRTSKGNRFYNFRQAPVMREKIYDIIQRESTDLFIFHEHGDYDTQYINGEYPAPNVIEKSTIGPLDALLISLRNSYRKYSGKRREAFVESVKEEYSLPESIFEKHLLDSLKTSDSLFAARINIMLPDIKPLKPLSTAVIFDACYNGSFHRDGYVAGYYIFGKGSTVVTQGNSVNVLQDKWTAELMGMLSMGARIGFWQKEVQFLESHLVGDPTIRFVSTADALNRSSKSAKFNYDLAVNRAKLVTWNSYLKSEYPAEQSIALKRLADCNMPGYTKLLLQYLKNSPYVTVRMEALKRLVDYPGEDMTEGLSLALNDQSELVRRNGARYAGYCGHESLISPLVKNILYGSESQRVQYAAQSSISMFDIDKTIKEIEKSNSPYTKDLIAYVKGEQKRQDKALLFITDKSAKPEDRISAIRNLRNYNNHKIVEELLKVVSDSSDDARIRVNLAEALGWFSYSYKKDIIIKALEQIASGPDANDPVVKEAKQSLIRLE